MHPLRWLFSKLSRPTRPPGDAPDSADSSRGQTDLDIVLSEIDPDALDARRDEATDYDVRSLGEPIDPVAARRKGN